MQHPTDRITHTKVFVTPVVEHWLEKKDNNNNNNNILSCIPAYLNNINFTDYKKIYKE